MSIRLQVDWIACEGHGLCAELLPERVGLDDWGYPLIDARDVSPEIEGHARRAVDVCPTLALALARSKQTARSGARTVRS